MLEIVKNVNLITCAQSVNSQIIYMPIVAFPVMLRIVNYVVMITYVAYAIMVMY